MRGYYQRVVILVAVVVVVVVVKGLHLQWVVVYQTMGFV